MSVIVFIFLQQVSEFDLFTLDDIDSAFQNVTRLTYSQNHHLSGTPIFLLALALFNCFFPPSLFGFLICCHSHQVKGREL